MEPLGSALNKAPSVDEKVVARGAVMYHFIDRRAQRDDGSLMPATLISSERGVAVPSGADSPSQSETAP